jgi:hypothetical protein
MLKHYNRQNVGFFFSRRDGMIIGIIKWFYIIMLWCMVDIAHFNIRFAYFIIKKFIHRITLHLDVNKCGCAEINGIKFISTEGFFLIKIKKSINFFKRLGLSEN